MFGHYLELGVRHLRRNPVLTALMIVTLAVGVAASISTLTVLRAMTGDPIPHKSDRLFVPLIDIRPTDSIDREPEPPPQLTYRDLVALHAARKGVRQSAMYRIAPVIEPARTVAPPWFAEGLAVHADFFAMLDVPFERGGPWTAEHDARGADVAVITRSVADQAFGDADPIGRTLRIQRRDHVITGVIPDDWEPLPRFYRLIAGPGAFGGEDEVLLPFENAISLELDNNGQTACYLDPPEHLPAYRGMLASPDCVWMTLWVELRSAADAPAYRDFLAGYVAEQRKLGRFPRPDNQRLYDVMEWLAVNEVVPKDRRLQTYLAFGFLLVCLVNTVGLLLAKFSARAGEIGVRRALGATRRAIFAQYLVEAGVVGVAGGVVGLGLTYGWLWFMSKQSGELELPELSRMDWVMMATTLALAIAASLLAGLLPTWRASRVAPARQLKSQ